MALAASPWRSRFEPSARTQEGAEAEDGDRRSANSRQARLRPPRVSASVAERRPGRRRASKSWSVWLVANNSTRFFRKALRLADALQGPAPARGETNSSLTVHERGGEVARRKRNDERAREGESMEVQHLCQLAQLSRPAIVIWLRRVNPTRRRRHSRCDPSHRTVRPLLRYRRIAEQLKREGLVVTQAGASVDAAR